MPGPLYTPYSLPFSIQIRHCPPPPQRPYYLRWLTALGNWEGWLFSGEADAKTTVDGPVSLAQEDGQQLALAKPGAESLTVRAGNLTTAQHSALATLLTSPQVYWQQADGSKIPIYVADNSSSSRTTADGRHVMELSVLLPGANSLTN